MNNLKDLIILRKSLVENIEKTKTYNINCMKNTFIKQQELNNTRKRYFSFIEEKQKLKSKKNRIIIFSIIFLITIILSLLTLIFVSTCLSNIINMIIFKTMINTLVLGELLLFISTISTMVLKYNCLKNDVNENLNKTNLKIIDIEKELKNLDKKHILFCKNLNINEAKLTNIDEKLYDSLFKTENIIKRSDVLLEKVKNKERVRIP